MRRLTMTAAEVCSVFRVSRQFTIRHRDALGGRKCGAHVVFPVAQVAGFFGVDKAELTTLLETEET